MGSTPKRSAVSAVDWREGVVAESLALELEGELRRDQVFTFLKRSVPMTQAVLQLSLQIVGEPIAQSDIDASDVITPLHFGSCVSDRAVELLIPAQGAEQLRSDLIFRLQVVGKGIGVPDEWSFEASFVKL